MKFISNLGYLGGGTLVGEVEKGLQSFINVRLLIGARSREERKTIFCKLQNHLDLLFNLFVADVFSFTIIVCRLYG